MTPLGRIDIAIVLAFVAYAVVSGLRARRIASRDLEQYFLAGRGLRGWQAGISMAATQFAADTPLLVTGLVATAGIFALWQLWIYALAFLLLGFVLAPSWRRARVLTDAELTELRYGGRAALGLRVVKALYFGTLFNCVVLAWVLFATKAIAEPFLVWDQWLPANLFELLRSFAETLGIPLATDPRGADVWTRTANNGLSLAAIVLVTLFYSATGGLRSVVRTDLLQFTLALGGTAVYALYVVHHAGGMDAIVATLAERFAEPTPTRLSASEILAFDPTRARHASAALLAVFALQWFIQVNADGTGYLAQRSMACRSDRDARVASLVFTFVQVVLRSLLWLPIALGLLVIFPPDPELPLAALRHEREVTFVRGIAELLPAGLRGLLLTALLAALASTVDTHLNWGASYWTHDLYDRVVCRAWRGRPARPRTLVWVARASTGLILVLALGVMTQLTSIERAWRVALLLGAGVGPLLVLRWLWWRISAAGELAALGVSLAAVGPLLGGVTSEALRLLSMAGLATGAGLLVSWWRPEDPARLRAFYRRALPPGWWGDIAEACGVPRREPLARLARGALALASAAVTVFGLLGGLGTWLCQSPAPLGWPLGRGAWIATLLGGALVAIPLWWRLGLHAPSPARPSRPEDPALS